jgi:hypothetical protein
MYVCISEVAEKFLECVLVRIRIPMEAKKVD